jgi:import inner membrane translocase subunit TIM23
LKKDGGGMFYEKMAGVIGPSYTVAFFVGGLLGLTKIPPPNARRTYRLLANNYLNNIGKTSSRFGNNVGGAVLMYLVIGKGLNFIFKEELEPFTEMQRNALYGAVTGAIYKSTRGLRPIIFASLLGASVGSAYSYAWDRGLFKFV